MLAHIDRIMGEHRPITADVFLNNFCNNRCPYCTFRRWELDADAYGMPLDRFVQVTERLVSFGVKGIILTGGGEPTITKDFDGICRYLEDNNIHYGINSNWNVLKYIKPDYLKVSLDGWDEDSYEKCRGVRAYGRVRRNIVEYADWKKANSPATTLGVQKVITNSSEIVPFYEGNKDLPFDYMALRPIESTGSKYYSMPDSMSDAQESIRLIEEIAKNDSRVVLNFKWHMLDAFPGSECTAHWTQIAVNEKGKIIYCCHKPYEVIGDIMEPDIMEKYAVAKTNISLCDVPCRLTAPNLFLSKFSEPIKDNMFI